MSDYHIATCPTCDAVVHGHGHLNFAPPGRCSLCGGIGVVRVRIKDIPIVRPNADGEWERSDDAVTQLGDAAPG